MITAENFYTNNFGKAAKFSISRTTIESVKKMIAAKDFNQVIEMAVKSSPRNQFVALASLYCLAAEISQQPADFNPADGIIWWLGESIAKYGEKAYPLSEAQVKLTLGKIWSYVK